jgi:hypothetical protein
MKKCFFFTNDKKNLEKCYNLFLFIANLEYSATILNQTFMFYLQSCIDVS